MKKETIVADLEVINQPAIIIPGCKILPGFLGLEIAPNITIEQWGNFAPFWRKMQNASQFMLGDWVNHGDSRYGEGYAQYVEGTGYDYSTISKASWVAKHVQFCRRRQNLSFEHHKEVAKLKPEDQTRWLLLAEEKRLTVKALRAAVKIGEILELTDEQKEEGICIRSLGALASALVDHIELKLRQMPLNDWSETRLKSAKKDLKPLVEFYNRL